MPTILKMRIVGDPEPERPDAVATPERTRTARPRIKIAGITAMTTSQTVQRGRTAARTIAAPNWSKPPRKRGRSTEIATNKPMTDLRKPTIGEHSARKKEKWMTQFTISPCQLKSQRL